MSLRFASSASASRAFTALSRWFASRRASASLGQMSGRDLADLGLSHAPEGDGLGLVGCERARHQGRC